MTESTSYTSPVQVGLRLVQQHRSRNEVSVCKPCWEDGCRRVFRRFLRCGHLKDFFCWWGNSLRSVSERSWVDAFCVYAFVCRSLVAIFPRACQKTIGILTFERKEEDCSSDVGLSNMTERVALPFLGRGLPDIEKA